jgi:hypothetical protein
MTNPSHQTFPLQPELPNLSARLPDTVPFPRAELQPLPSHCAVVRAHQFHSLFLLDTSKLGVSI